MLTLKLITEQTERVIAGLEKKHFADARQAIEEVIAVDKARRGAQTELDQNLSAAKKLAAEIGMLMKQGKRDEAEAVKAKVAALKRRAKTWRTRKSRPSRSLRVCFARFPIFHTTRYPKGRVQKTIGS